ncbi:response regulator transcription factor [Vallitalea okinawensis]|uniref:response regulator transcription factor n=1 Tax=Vallitalea okinawensis TaxID=2078660 RepID=UPI000CFBF314|nr:response regulator [Vallitalea okinawensis]
MNILIAEDMEWIRKGIVKMINNMELEYDNVFEASNGVEALEIVKEHLPELVITDIRMPIKDGLELINDAKPIIPNSEFIILTGYAEFTYAQQAVNLGVKGFILKPIQDEKFKQAISKAIFALIEKDSYKKVLQEKDELVKEQKELFFENELNKVFLGKENEEIDTIQNYNVLALIRFDHGRSKKELLMGIVKSMKTTCRIVVADNHSNNNEYFVLICHNNMNVLKIDHLDIACKLVKGIRKENHSVYGSTSLIKKNITKEMYSEANEALLQRLIDQDKVIYQFNAKHMDNISNIHVQNLILLKMGLEKRDSEQIGKSINDLFQSSMEGSVGQIAVLWSLVSTMIIEVFQLTIDEIKQYNLLNNYFINQCETLDDVKGFINNVIKEIINSMHSSNIDDHTIDKIQDYIQKNYMKDITAQKIAEEFNISLSYLSTTFKKHSGTKLSQYITSKRIDEATRLLLHTNINVSDISKTVGYQDVQYFYRVFKKYTGKTPLGFRKEKALQAPT